MQDHPTYTGRGLIHTDHRQAYNEEARRIGWPMRICDYCGCEARSRCVQSDGGAAGWYENDGTVSCGPCRNAEFVTPLEVKAAKRGRAVRPFRPGEDIH